MQLIVSQKFFLAVPQIFLVLFRFNILTLLLLEYPLRVLHKVMVNSAV